ncbi:methyltransferase domain-containing protein [Rhizobium lemnae]|uniref:Methyltransferase domain-containing protein n=1 Tax=Rhizobium lemnae TaxID=1214924 RepID=A0ABV8E5R0_9HYPH|nr:methyltransferase domain-containing protein [Rhizobium lemnae]MCJ8510350.1 methyltransferase domain-containing protein [Rhizobium lemnae]
MQNRELLFPIHEHAIMLADSVRVQTIKRAISCYASSESTFIELGCGTGIFTLFAAGLFSRAVGVERDPRTLKFGQAVAEIKSGAADVEFVLGDVFDYIDCYDGPKFDVVFSELLSPWLLREPLISVMSGANRKLLKSGGKLLPSLVRLVAQIGTFDFQFSGIELLSYHYDFLNAHRFQALSLPRVIAEITVGNAIAGRMEGAAEFDVLAVGEANAVKITTMAELAPGVVLWGTPSIMPDVIVPLELRQTLDNNPVILDWKLETESSLENVHFKLRRSK